jgi:hypothetical protein
VDATITELGHEPNGEFWNGVTSYLLATSAKSLRGRFDTDPEAGMFVAYGSDRGALVALGERLSALANDPDAIRALVLAAEEEDFAFDD